MERDGKQVYVIVSTVVNSDIGIFQSPCPMGGYHSLRRARKALQALIQEEKEGLSARYNKEELTEDSWEAYEDGYAAACFTRLEIITVDLLD